MSVILALGTSTGATAHVDGALAPGAVGTAVHTPEAVLSDKQVHIVPDLTLWLLEQATATLQVDNTSTVGGGPYPISNVTLYVTLSSNLRYDGFEGAQGSCSGEAKSTGMTLVTCEVGEVDAEAILDLYLKLTPIALGLATLRAELVASEYDPDEANNTVSYEATVGEGAPELEITNVYDEVPMLGEVVTYTVTVRNVGSATAESVVMEYGPDDPLRLVDGGGLCTGIANTDNLRCSLGDLPAGDSAVVRLAFRYWDNGIYGRSAVESNAWATASNADAVETSVSFAPEELLTDFFVFYLSGATPTLDKRASTRSYDVYVAGEPVAESVAPDTAVAVRAPLRSISPEIAVVEAGSADLSDPVFTAEVDFFTEVDGAFSLPDRYSLTFTEEGGALRLLLQREVRAAASDPAKVEFFFAHTDATPGALDLQLVDGTPTPPTLVDDLEPGTPSGYVALEPGVHDLALTSGDGRTLHGVFRVDWSAAAGGVYSVIALQTDGGTALVMTDAEGVIRTAAPVATHTAPRSALPTAYYLGHSYPNPFNLSTAIPFTLPESGVVHLAVYDVLGRVVRTLISTEQAAGSYHMAWDGRDGTGRPVVSGLYFYTLTAGAFLQTRSMILMR